MPDFTLPGNTVRSKYTRKQLRDKVKSQIGVLDNVFIRPEDIDDYLLGFQFDLAQDEEWNEVTGFFSTSGGVRYYDMPTDCITLKLVQFDVWPLPHRSLHSLIQEFPLALTTNFTSSRPWSYTMCGVNRILLFPLPTVASGVMVIYAALPPEPVSDDSKYYWPPYFDTAAIYYCCMRASLKDISRDGPKRIANFTAAFEREYMRACARLKGRGEEDTAVYGRRQVAHSTGYGTYPRKVPFPPS